MTEIDDAWQALNKNGFALDYDEDSRPGSLAKAIDYALAAKDDDIGRRDERIGGLEAQIEKLSGLLAVAEYLEKAAERKTVLLERAGWRASNAHVESARNNMVSAANTIRQAFVSLSSTESDRD